MNAARAGLARIPTTPRVDAATTARVAESKARRNEGQPIQRVKILLRQEDPELLGLLRQVPVPNEGAQTLQDPAQVQDLDEIGVNESIVLEGHGHLEPGCFGAKVVGQGRRTPAELARIVHRVPKPRDWAGDVYLMGCRTGAITKAVSQAYHRLADKAVTVRGTKAGVRVGRDEADELFIGTDWAEEPERDRPRDLAFVAELEQTVKLFPPALIGLANLAGELQNYLEDLLSGGAPENPRNLHGDLDQVEARFAPFGRRDADSRHDRRPGRDYKEDVRLLAYRDFRRACRALDRCSAFQPPAQAIRPRDNHRASKQLATAVARISTFAGHRAPVLELGQYINGLRLKRIDLEDANDLTSSRRTRGSTLGIQHWKNG